MTQPARANAATTRTATRAMMPITCLSPEEGKEERLRGGRDAPCLLLLLVVVDGGGGAGGGSRRANGRDAPRRRRGAGGGGSRRGDLARLRRKGLHRRH